MTDSNRGDRLSIRLPGYDYARPGAYFITVVTHRRLPLFGEVVSRDANLSALGRIADQCWRELPLHFPHVELGASVIMPNHIHGILILHDTAATSNRDADAPAFASRRGTIYRAPTVHRVATEAFGAPRPGAIPTIVRTYKAAVTRQARRERYPVLAVWQRNYYEHVIRDQREWEEIHRYIESNPLMWMQDRENPDAGT
ncbi:MAG TPA: hypothetical protein VIU38_08685 [Anaerolineales bacterium]